jgi:hypothetical protein
MIAVLLSGMEGMGRDDMLADMDAHKRVFVSKCLHKNEVSLGVVHSVQGLEPQKHLFQVYKRCGGR